MQLKRLAAAALVLVAAVGVVAAAYGAPGAARTFTVHTAQRGATKTHPHMPPGPVGDTYDEVLVLSNAAPQFGKTAGASVGTMRLEFTIRKQCSGLTTKPCTAYADFTTTSKLPGGSVRAGGKHISISKPVIVIPVTGGTGAFAGAHGTVSVSPAQTRRNVYRLER